MEPTQKQMVYCCAEQWVGGHFHRVEPYGEGLYLNCQRNHTGFYGTAPIDSGENGFRWQRIVVDAVLPPDTSLRVYAYAADTLQWKDGVPLDEWLERTEELTAPVLQEVFGAPRAECGDFYAGCAGRYLWLLFELAATGASSPSIRGMRVWFGGDHMTDYLPAIYREDDFTRRFLSIFDSIYTDMDRAIDALPGRIDYENADEELLRCLASWVCVEQDGTREELCQAIGSALGDYENRYTVEGVRRSIRRLTGREPILLEHFEVSPNRMDCGNPALYRRLYGDDPHRCFALLPENTFPNQQALQKFQRDMEQLLPAGLSLGLVQLKQCVQLDWHTYLGINSRVGGYVPAAIDEQVTIHYDTTIGGVSHE